MFRIFSSMTIVLLTGCQSKLSAVKIVCNAPLHCTQCVQAETPEDRQRLLGEYITKKVRNPEVKQVLDSISAINSPLPKETFSDYVKSFEITSCPLIDPVELIEVDGISLPKK